MAEENTKHCCKSCSEEHDNSYKDEIETQGGACGHSSQARDKMNLAGNDESTGCCKTCEVQSEENDESEDTQDLENARFVRESIETEEQGIEELRLELEEKKMQITLLASELQKEQNMKEELISRLQRLQAEFDNYRRRTQTEKEELAKFAIQDFLLRLLPVIDNFERAIDAASDAKDASSLYEGVEMIYRQLIDVLGKEEVFPIDAVGEPFDPNKHEAFMVEESDEVDENIVLEEFKRGYEFRGKVIRPSMVKVSQKG